MHAAKISNLFETSKKNVDYFSFCGQSACRMTVARIVFYVYIPFIRELFVSLQQIIKQVKIMTAIQLRAELFREMNPLLDSEAALEKMLAFVRTLVAAKKDKTDDTKTARQQAYVKETLTRALNEVKEAQREGRKLQTVDEFIKELRMEEETV